jgi:hypothetical protein
MQERRKHVRITSTTILQYKKGFLSPTDETVTKDISLQGLCFFSQKSFKFGSVIKLKIYFDTKDSTKIVRGKVVWSTPYKDSVFQGFLNGLVFLPR